MGVGVCRKMVELTIEVDYRIPLWDIFGLEVQSGQSNPVIIQEAAVLRSNLSSTKNKGASKEREKTQSKTEPRKLVEPTVDRFQRDHCGQGHAPIAGRGRQAGDLHVPYGVQN